jgi:hypothetical protein
VRLDFTRLPGSCVVVVVHSESTLDVEHFLFFGGTPDVPMPSVENDKRSIAPGRRDQSGNQKIREHYRDIARAKFRGPLSASELLGALFPSRPG